MRRLRLALLGPPRASGTARPCGSTLAAAEADEPADLVEGEHLLAEVLHTAGHRDEAEEHQMQAARLFAEIDDSTDRQPLIWTLVEWQCAAGPQVALKAETISSGANRSFRASWAVAVAAVR